MSFVACLVRLRWNPECLEVAKESGPSLEATARLVSRLDCWFAVVNAEIIMSVGG